MLFSAQVSFLKCDRGICIVVANFIDGADDGDSGGSVVPAGDDMFVAHCTIAGGGYCCYQK